MLDGSDQNDLPPLFNHESIADVSGVEDKIHPFKVSPDGWVK
jgi:hypothetical protein